MEEPPPVAHGVSWRDAALVLGGALLASAAMNFHFLLAAATSS